MVHESIGVNRAHCSTHQKKAHNDKAAKHQQQARQKGLVLLLRGERFCVASLSWTWLQPKECRHKTVALLAAKGRLARNDWMTLHWDGSLPSWTPWNLLLSKL